MAPIKPSAHYISPAVGNQIDITLFGVPDIRNPDLIMRILREGLHLEKFTIEAEAYIPFPGNAMTATFVLSESHLAAHSYPEHGSLALQLYSCRGPEDGRKTMEHIVASLSPEAIDFHEREVPIVKEVAGTINPLYGGVIEARAGKLRNLKQR